MDRTLSLFFFKLPLGEGKRSPKLHPGGWFFGPWSFIILKNSHQDLSNEGSNFILSSLEVEWVCVALLEFKILPQLKWAKSSVLSIYIVVLVLTHSRHEFQILNSRGVEKYLVKPQLSIAVWSLVWSFGHGSVPFKFLLI